MKDKVSWLMVTDNRLPMMQRAVHCFQSQSHPNRELVVVNRADDGTEEYVRDLNDDRIVYVRPERLDLTLGELRNLSVASASGTYVMVWDDDDWHHPRRIEVQLAALLETGSDLCFLNRVTLAWPSRNLYFYSKRRPWEMSMLAFRAKLPAYPPLSRGEDAELFRRSVDYKLKICTVDKAELYIYVVHGRNTCNYQHFTSAIFDEVTSQIQGAEVNEILAKLELSPENDQSKQTGPCLPRPPGPAAVLGAAPSICVLIPVHNQAKYLYRAVTSALWQMEPQDEIIVVDDGSTDIVDYAGLRPFLKRILWLSNPIAKGVSHSRNRGIKASRADWIKLLDADDVLTPFALSILHRVNPPIPPYVKLITGGCHRMHNGQYMDYLCANQETLNNILRYLPTLPSATFIRREALLEVGLFDEQIDLEEDWD